MSPYDFETDEKHKLIRVRAWGKMSKKEGTKAIVEARRLAMEHGYDLLYDIREMELEGVSLADFYYLPREQGVFSQPDSRKAKVAIIVSEQMDKITDYKFYEDVTQNLGFSVKIFTGFVEAENWLFANRTDTE